MLLPHLYCFILSTEHIRYVWWPANLPDQEDSKAQKTSSSSRFQQGLNCSYHSGSLHPVIFFANKYPNYHYHGAYSNNTPCCREIVIVW